MLNDLGLPGNVCKVSLHFSIAICYQLICSDAFMHISNLLYDIRRPEGNLWTIWIRGECKLSSVNCVDFIVIFIVIDCVINQYPNRLWFGARENIIWALINLNSITGAYSMAVSQSTTSYASEDPGNCLMPAELLRPRPSPLQWCHRGRYGSSNHRHVDCLLNRLLRRSLQKNTSKLRVTVLCEGNSPGQ